MSWTDVKDLYKLDRVWDPLHFAVMFEIAVRYHPSFGYAWPSLALLARRYDRSVRRINEVTGELEQLALLIRLGPDPDVLGSRRGTQRFVPIWRVPDGVQQQLRAAVDADAAPSGAQPWPGLGGLALEGGDPSHGGTRPVAWEARDGSHGRHAMGRVRSGTSDGTSTYNLLANSEDRTDLDLRSRGSYVGIKVGDRTETAAAAAQPQLPTLLAQIRRTLLDEILRKRHAFLAAVPASDDNFKALAKAATDVLSDPALGARLLKGYDPTIAGDVREAVRRLCDKRHIEWGKPSYGPLNRAIAWAELRPKMLAGEARPRELADRQRRRG